MSSNRLHLNTSKTRVHIWRAPAGRRHHIPINDAKDFVHPSVQSARDLGVYVNVDMTMTTHINYVLSSCFGAPRQMRSIMLSLPPHVLDTRAISLVHIAALTVATSCLRVFRFAIFNVSRQFLTPPCDLSLANHIAAVQDRCYETVSLAAHSATCTVRALHAGPPLSTRTSSIILNGAYHSRLPLQTTELVYGPPTRRLPCSNNQFCIYWVIVRSPSPLLVSGISYHRTFDLLHPLTLLYI